MDCSKEVTRKLLNRFFEIFNSFLANLFMNLLKALVRYIPASILIRNVGFNIDWVLNKKVSGIASEELRDSRTR